MKTGSTSLTDMSVMIVDDSAVIRAVVKDLLTELGFSRLYEVSDGEQALKIYRDKKPSIIFLDLQLPKYDGKQVAQEMIEDNPHVKIIVASAEAPESELGKDLIRLGAFGYIRKPVRRDELDKVISKLKHELSGSSLAEIEIPENIMYGSTLLEFNPSVRSDLIGNFYKNFTSRFNDIHLFTSPGSLIHSIFKSNGLIRLHFLSSSSRGSNKLGEVISMRDHSLIADSFSRILENLGSERTVIIFDSLTDLILQTDFESSYALTTEISRLVAPHEVTVLFLLNVQAHQPREIAAFRGVFPKRVSVVDEITVENP